MTFAYFDSSAFGSFMQLMNSIGMFDYIFPFLLYFAIVYGLLERAAIFGKNDSKKGERVNFIVSFSIAFLILAYVPGATSVGEVLAELLQKWALLVVGLLLIPLILALFKIDIGNMFYTEDDKGNKKLSGAAWAIFVLVLIMVAVIFYDSLGNLFPAFWIYIDKRYLGLIIVIGLIIGGILYVGSEEDNEKTNSS